MKTRAEQLSQRIESGFETLAKYAERLSESQWSTVIPPDGRRAGVIIHHVASVYPIEVHLAKEVARRLSPRAAKLTVIRALCS